MAEQLQKHKNMKHKTTLYSLVVASIFLSISINCFAQSANAQRDLHPAKVEGTVPIPNFSQMAPSAGTKPCSNESTLAHVEGTKPCSNGSALAHIEGYKVIHSVDSMKYILRNNEPQDKEMKAREAQKKPVNEPIKSN